jgi:N-acetylmuramoyl-L-alanine amidase
VAEIHAALVHLRLLGELPADPVFDEPTDRAVREFQQNRGLVVDGLVGPETWGALQSARLSLGDRLLSLAGRMYVGDDVTALQERLAELGFDTGRVDGVFGPLTEAALKGFQKDYGLVPDGVCGPRTLRALKQLGRLVTGGRPQ